MVLPVFRYLPLHRLHELDGLRDLGIHLRSLPELLECQPRVHEGYRDFAQFDQFLEVFHII